MDQFERDAVLDMWAGGFTAGEIEGESGIPRERIARLIRNEGLKREAADPRADAERHASAKQARATMLKARPMLPPGALLCPELGIEAITRIVRNRHTYENAGNVDPYVAISLPRVIFLEGLP